MTTYINEPIETMDLCFVKGFALNNENDRLELKDHCGDSFVKLYSDPKDGLADYDKLVSRFVAGEY
jgi:putative heme degradation protein